MHLRTISLKILFKSSLEPFITVLEALECEDATGGEPDGLFTGIIGPWRYFIT